MSSLIGSKGPTGRGVAGYRTGSIQNYTPEQMNLFRSLFSNVSPDSYLSKLAGGDEAMFEQIERPQLRQFNDIQGNLAARFSGQAGGGRQLSLGSQKSSGFRNTLNAAGADFAESLGARRQELQRQALRDLMDISSTLLEKKPYEQFLYEKKKPFWQQILGGSLPIIGSGVGALFGGPAGAQVGGSIGSAASKAFF